MGFEFSKPATDFKDTPWWGLLVEACIVYMAIKRSYYYLILLPVAYKIIPVIDWLRPKAVSLQT